MFNNMSSSIVYKTPKPVIIIRVRCKHESVLTEPSHIYDLPLEKVTVYFNNN